MPARPDASHPFIAFAICYQAGEPEGGYAPPPLKSAPFRYRPVAGEPSRTFGYQIALLIILNCLSETNAAPVRDEDLINLNALFNRADQYGAFTIDWGGCRFATKREGSVFTVQILEPNPRLEKRFAEIAKSFGDAHHARCLASNCLPETAINYNRRRRVFHMAAIAG